MATAIGLVPPLVGLLLQLLDQGPQRYAVGGWMAPLGIELYVDGLSLLMLAVTGIVGSATTLFATGYYSSPKERRAEPRQDPGSSLFWPIWLLMWASLNGMFLSADIFNLYVSLELLGLSAVALVASAGKPNAITAAMRYLLVSLLASMGYLLGVTFLYFSYGTLSLHLLGEVLRSTPTTLIALTLMTLSLSMKTALFPVHFWLPPAHANAPAPVSTILSSLVVKASFYLLLRLWFQVFAGVITPYAAHLLGALGVAAILWGSIHAMLAERLKLLIAYSTVAQLGYLFLVFPLSQSKGTGFSALSGGLYFVLAHACAKGAAFLAAGTVLYGLGHDRIDELDGAARRLPVTLFAFALAAVSLMGLPPSGGFLAKWVLLNAALAGGQWWLAVVILLGGLLAAVYLFRVFSRAFRYVEEVPACRPVPWSMEFAALGLGLVALGLGVTGNLPFEILRIGAPLSGPVLTGGTP